MLLVETYVEMSTGRGIGLYANENIPFGTKYWIRNDFYDKVYTSWQLKQFNKLARDFIKKYGFLEKNGNWYLCGDNARFSNHSTNPNTQNHFNSHGILQYCTASKNIVVGEEIFCDYKEICYTCKKGVKFTAL